MYVALIRAVMQGRDGLRREVLVDIFDRAGAVDPTTHLTTGNVSFRSDPESLDAVVASAEADLEAVVGRPTPVFVRSHADIRDLVDADPFASSPFADPIACEVSFFRHRVPDHIDLPVESARGDWVAFASSGREIFSVQRLVNGRSQSAGGRIERLAGEPITTRAIGTLARIVAT